MRSVIVPKKIYMDSLKGQDHLESVNVDGKIIWIWNLMLWLRSWTFGFYKTQESPDLPTACWFVTSDFHGVWKETLGLPVFLPSVSVTVHR